MSLLLTQESDTQWSLKGPLNVATIKRVWQQGHRILDITKASQVNLNLEHLTDPDSASVALLLDWLRYAKKHNKTLRLHNVPKKMQDIIRLSNLQDILV
jgi:phospholipid transport system transporter-binding protein